MPYGTICLAARYTFGTICAFGAPFDPTYYTDYLTKKFTGLYRLN